MQRYGFLQIASDLVQCRALGNDRNFHAFCDISRFLSGTDDRFDGVLQRLHSMLSLYSVPVSHNHFRKRRTVAEALNYQEPLSFHETKLAPL
jgi:hypothetical protein